MSASASRSQRSTLSCVCCRLLCCGHVLEEVRQSRNGGGVGPVTDAHRQRHHCRLGCCSGRCRRTLPAALDCLCVWVFVCDDHPCEAVGQGANGVDTRVVRRGHRKHIGGRRRRGRGGGAHRESAAATAFSLLRWHERNSCRVSTQHRMSARTHTPSAQQQNRASADVTARGARCRRPHGSRPKSRRSTRAASLARRRWRGAGAANRFTVLAIRV